MHHATFPEANRGQPDARLGAQVQTTKVAGLPPGPVCTPLWGQLVI
jgi:hypothetical protein